MGTIQRWKKEVPPTNSVYVIENCDGLSSISNKAINVSPDDDAVYAIVKTTTTQECPRNRPGIVGTLHKIRSYLWLLPLIHNEFWISAGFSLIQPFFPDLVSSQCILFCLISVLICFKLIYRAYRPFFVTKNIVKYIKARRSNFLDLTQGASCLA